MNDAMLRCLARLSRWDARIDRIANRRHAQEEKRG